MSIFSIHKKNNLNNRMRENTIQNSNNIDFDSKLPSGIELAVFFHFPSATFRFPINFRIECGAQCAVSFRATKINENINKRKGMCMRKLIYAYLYNMHSDGFHIQSNWYKIFFHNSSFDGDGFCAKVHERGKLIHINFPNHNSERRKNHYKI